MKKNQIIVFILITLLSFALRFSFLSSNPPGVYWDEAAFGYDAYSLSQIGRDQHGRFMPLFFESFGDWKLPGYFYLLVPVVKAIGLSSFSVRFPSALLGSLTPLIFFLLIRKITSNTNLALTCMFFLAISPWHIQFSRGGFESTAGLFFVTFAVYLFLKAVDTKSRVAFICSSVLFVFSMYTYHAYRIFTPLFIIALLILFFDKIKKNIRILLLPALVAFFLLIPIAVFTFSQEGTVRATSQSAFKKNDLEQARLDFDQKSKKPFRFLSKFIYQPLPYYSQIVLKGYFDHFSPTFLFLEGDSIGRHSQVDMGQIYLFDAFLLICSVFAAIKLKIQNIKIMVIWLLLSPIPATIVTPTPHAYRTLQMVIPLAFFSGLGAYCLFLSKKHIFLKIALLLIIIYSFAAYTHLLFIHYPKKFAADWQDGYRQMVDQVKKYQNNYEKVYVTNINQVPYIYLLFYQSYDPAKFIAGKGSSDSFDKYVFISPEEDIYNKGRILYVAPSWQKVDGKWLAAANDSSGRHIYSLWEVGGKN